jgi:hypothetical protein
MEIFLYINTFTNITYFVFVNKERHYVVEPKNGSFKGYYNNDYPEFMQHLYTEAIKL